MDFRGGEMNTIKLPDLVSDLARVGGGFSVRFSLSSKDFEDGVCHISCMWYPTMPTAQDLRRKVNMDRYEAALNHFVLEIVMRTGFICLDSRKGTQ